MSIDGETFEVWYLDQMNEGREVWAIYDDACDTYDIARDVAAAKAGASEYKRARIVHVKRSTLAQVEVKDDSPVPVEIEVMR